MKSAPKPANTHMGNGMRFMAFLLGIADRFSDGFIRRHVESKSNAKTDLIKNNKINNKLNQYVKYAAQYVCSVGRIATGQINRN
jgi:hypothetical protein